MASTKREAEKISNDPQPPLSQSTTWAKKPSVQFKNNQRQRIHRHFFLERKDTNDPCLHVRAKFATEHALVDTLLSRKLKSVSK